jgi:hypothetical protein
VWLTELVGSVHGCDFLRRVSIFCAKGSIPASSGHGKATVTANARVDRNRMPNT